MTADQALSGLVKNGGLVCVDGGFFISIYWNRFEAARRYQGRILFFAARRFPRRLER